MTPTEIEAIPHGQAFGVHIAMDILGLLPKSTHDNRCILVITDLLNKLTGTILLKSTTVTEVAMAILVHSIYLYAIPLYLLT